MPSSRKFVLPINIGSYIKIHKHLKLQRYHHCPINHTGSANSLETSGVKQIFQRTVEEKKLRYTTYLNMATESLMKMLSF